MSSSSSIDEQLSVLSVLQTALPDYLVSEALTDSAAVSAEIASQFAAGYTPSWFRSLPPDVKTYLIPGALNTSSASPSFSSSVATSTSIVPTTQTREVTSDRSSEVSSGESSRASPSRPTGASVSLRGTEPAQPTETPQPNNTGAIAGGVVGGVLGLALIIGGMIAVLKYRKRQRRRQAMDEISAQPAVSKDRQN